MQSGAPPLAGEVERETDNQDQTSAKIIVLGGAVVDIVARPREGSPLLISTSNPGTYIESDGGVGRNVAEALARLGCRPALYTTVGNDDRGRGLLERFEEIGGINHSHIVSCSPTATYLAFLNGAGDLHAAIADMQIFKDMEPPSRMAIRGARFLVMDANPSLVVLEEAARIANENGVQVCLEPTSVPKARLVADNLELLSYISYAFPNSDELFAMADKITDQPGFSGYTPNLKNNTESAAAILLRHMHPTKATLVVSMGEKGVLLATRQGQELSFVNFAVNDPVTLVSNATGAGDSLCGAFLAALLHDKTLREAVEIGMEAGRLSVQTSEAAISPLLNQLRDKLL
jgi:sugar/nucleoside kinase (ribokinase family)